MPQRWRLVVVFAAGLVVAMAAALGSVAANAATGSAVSWWPSWLPSMEHNYLRWLGVSILAGAGSGFAAWWAYRWFERGLDELPPEPDAGLPSRWLRVKASDPELARWMRVHPAEPASPNAVDAAWWYELPAYLSRDHDTRLRQQLRAAAATGGSVVVSGESSTGKSRSLLEAIRIELPRWDVVVLAADGAAVRDAATKIQAPAVFVLDNTPDLKYLRPDGEEGLTAAEVLNMIRDATHPVIFVHVLWPGALADILTGRASGKTGLPDPFTEARSVVSLSAGPNIEVRAQLGPGELAAARSFATADVRWQKALTDQEHGPMQTLGGTPHLLERWSLANGYERAILHAATDLRRVGYERPFTPEFLEAAAVGYLNPHDHRRAATDWFTHAWHTLCDIGRGYTAPLEPVTLLDGMPGHHQGHTLTDVLRQQGQHERGFLPAAASMWEALLGCDLSPEETRRLADTTHARLLFTYSDELYARLPADQEITRVQVERLRYQGRTGEAIDLLRKRSVESKGALLSLIGVLAAEKRSLDLYRLLAETGLREVALELTRLLVKIGRPAEAVEVIWPFHEAGVLGTGESYSKALAAAGRLDDAIAELRVMNTQGTENAAYCLYYLLKEHGRPHDAAQFLKAHLDSGIDDPFLPEHLAETYREIDDLDALRDLAPQLIFARFELAKLYLARGMRAEASMTFQEIWQSRGEPEALNWRVELLVEDGNEHALGELVQQGLSQGAIGMSRLLHAQGNTSQALRLLEPHVHAGDLGAIWTLSELGQSQTAIAELQRQVAAGVWGAASMLAGMLASDDNLERAIEVLQVGYFKGDVTASSRIPHLLVERGRLHQLQTYIAAGHPASVGHFLQSIAEQQHDSPLSYLLPHGLTADGELASAAHA